MRTRVTAQSQENFSPLQMYPFARNGLLHRDNDSYKVIIKLKGKYENVNYFHNKLISTVGN
jgi:hypothetical protein